MKDNGKIILKAHLFTFDWMLYKVSQLKFVVREEKIIIFSDMRLSKVQHNGDSAISN